MEKETFDMEFLVNKLGVKLPHKNTLKYILYESYINKLNNRIKRLKAERKPTKEVIECINNQKEDPYSGLIKAYHKIIEGLYCCVNNEPENIKIRYKDLKFKIDIFTHSYILALMSQERNAGSFIHKIKYRKFDQITAKEKKEFLNDLFSELSKVDTYGCYFEEWKTCVCDIIGRLSFDDDEYEVYSKIEKFISKTKFKKFNTYDFEDGIYKILEKYNQNNKIRDSLVSEIKSTLEKNDYISYAENEWQENIERIYNCVMDDITATDNEITLSNKIKDMVQTTLNTFYSHHSGENIFVPTSFIKCNSALNSDIDIGLAVQSNMSSLANELDYEERGYLLLMLKKRIEETLIKWEDDVGKCLLMKIEDPDYDIIQSFE